MHDLYTDYWRSLRSGSHLRIPLVLSLIAHLTVVAFVAQAAFQSPPAPIPIAYEVQLITAPTPEPEPEVAPVKAPPEPEPEPEPPPKPKPKPKPKPEPEDNLLSLDDLRKLTMDKRIQLINQYGGNACLHVKEAL